MIKLTLNDTNKDLNTIGQVILNELQIPNPNWQKITALNLTYRNIVSIESCLLIEQEQTKLTQKAREHIYGRSTTIIPTLVDPDGLAILDFFKKMFPDVDVCETDNGLKLSYFIDDKSSLINLPSSFKLWKDISKQEYNGITSCGSLYTMLNDIANVITGQNWTYRVEHAPVKSDNQIIYGTLDIYTRKDDTTCLSNEI